MVHVPVIAAEERMAAASQTPGGRPSLFDVE
jgi:hypothetical protein